jgi:hypothetical protein
VLGVPLAQQAHDVDLAGMADREGFMGLPEVAIEASLTAAMATTETPSGR